MKPWHWVSLGIANLVFIVLEFSQPVSGEHQQLWWSSIPLFYMFYGITGCTLLIVVAKWLGKLILQQKEDYYDVG